MRLNLSLKYTAFTAIAVFLVTGVALLIVSRRHERLITTQIEMQAKALFQQIVITRRWVSDHGGVFVEKLPWVRPNPYLYDSIVIDRKGRQFVKQNPALVTKQLSSYAQKEGLYFFHITSLRLVNPDNAPDAFETRSLMAFESGTMGEAFTIEELGGSKFFRYIAPLRVEISCLGCHAKQGYKMGDIRGGISVSVPMDAVLGTVKQDRRYLIAGGLVASAVLMLLMFVMTNRMVIRPIATIRAMMYRFSKDGKPDMPLLATGDEIEDLSASFRDMAERIYEYHTCLQNKINASTKELMEKNEELLRLNRAKSDFLVKISHELRTPLTTIKGAMDYLSVKLPKHTHKEDEDHLVFFGMIKKNADRLIRLVDNLLDYERIELGSFEMRLSETNLKETFTEVVSAFMPLASEKDIRLTLDARDAVAVVDEDRIKQVMTNLLSNAINFAPPASEIIVSIVEESGDIKAAVEDQGPGISEEERDNIFRQFYTRGVKNGTGLGLAICRGIVEAHSGKIGVESGRSGGSLFWFTIPKERIHEEQYGKTAACNR